MYKYVARHHKKSANCNIPNDAGLTPLTLACKLGRHNVFKEIIELESEVRPQQKNLHVIYLFTLSPVCQVSH